MGLLVTEIERDMSFLRELFIVKKPIELGGDLQN